MTWELADFGIFEHFEIFCDFGHFGVGTDLLRFLSRMTELGLFLEGEVGRTFFVAQGFWRLEVGFGEVSDTFGVGDGGRFNV